ncbi:hypothetical protein [Saliniramus sp.]|uniref:hypothetical protein n=1 Tax=Saliniramus sp. TaxID=2986772 RepID=UPI002C8AD710|nr:hypothetical protein [Saliniramus sp.]HMB11696.1 hypothetical protein [Saliniramus sp.]
MPKQNITTHYAEEHYAEDTHDGGTEIALTPCELRALYLLRENHVQELVEVAVMLDDGQRRLALRMLKAMVEHRRSMLS